MLSGVLWLRIWWRGAGEEPAIPDMPLSAFVEGRLGANVADRDETPPEEILTGINGVFGSIRQMAALGVITVWGRQNCALGHAHVPITQIPQKYWEQGAEIDMLDYLKGGQHKLGKLTSNVFGNKSDYTDVWLNKKEIAKAFPRRLPRLKFNFPVTLEKRQ